MVMKNSPLAQESKKKKKSSGKPLSRGYVGMDSENEWI